MRRSMDALIRSGVLFIHINSPPADVGVAVSYRLAMWYLSAEAAVHYVRTCSSKSQYYFYMYVRRHLRTAEMCYSSLCARCGSNYCTVARA